MPALGQRVITTTQEKLVPKVVDTVLNENVLATRVLSAAKPFQGRKQEYPIKFQKGQSGSSFSGLDQFSTNTSDVRRKLSYDPKFYELNVTLPFTEISANKTEQGIIDIVSQELQSRAQDMADEIGDLFYGDGTGNSSKDFLGLEALVDDGTNASTIGGLSRSTYSTLNSTVTASGGTLTFAKMDTLHDAISDGSQEPTAILTTKTIKSLYGQLLRPQERIMKSVGMGKSMGFDVGTGFKGYDYRGIPLMSDRKCTSGVMYMLNEDFIEWRTTPAFPGSTPVNFKSTIEGNDYSSVKGLGFTWSGFMKPTNAAAWIGHIYLGGELMINNPKRSGKLTGITSI